MNSFEYLV